MSLTSRLFPKRHANWVFLRQLTDEVGREVEARSHEQLGKAAEDQPLITRTVNDVYVYWQVDCIGRDKDDNLRICIDCHSKLSTPFGILPSYVFTKMKDGTVRY